MLEPRVLDGSVRGLRSDGLAALAAKRSSAVLETADFRRLWRSCERALVHRRGRRAVRRRRARRTRRSRWVLAVALHAGVDVASLRSGYSLIVPATMLAAWGRAGGVPAPRSPREYCRHWGSRPRARARRPCEAGRDESWGSQPRR